MSPREDTILVTGGSGFIGSELVRHLVSYTNARVVNLDCLTYAAVQGTRLSGLPSGRYVHENIDIRDGDEVREVVAKYQPRQIFHLAAESHVDRAIDGAIPFIRTNVEGTHNLLEAALWTFRKQNPYFGEMSEEDQRPFLIHVSTDEVYGSLPPTRLASREEDILAPGNPYAATKAAAEHLVLAYSNTFGLPVAITRGSNTYGPWQHPEKFIPKVILSALEMQPVTLYGDGRQQRSWLHVSDHVTGLLTVAEKGRPGRVYNIGSDYTWDNLGVARRLCQYVTFHAGDNQSRRHLITHVRDRPGHDYCYLVSTRRLKELGWYPRKTFSGVTDPETDLFKTVRWYYLNQQWLRQADDPQRLGLRGTSDGTERDHSGSGQRDETPPSHLGDQQAAAPGVRQADDFLPVDPVDGGGDPPDSADHDCA